MTCVFSDDILKYIFLYENCCSWNKFSLTLVPTVNLTIIHDWCGHLLGSEQDIRHNPKERWFDLLTHICIAQPRWHKMTHRDIPRDGNFILNRSMYQYRQHTYNVPQFMHTICCVLLCCGYMFSSWRGYPAKRALSAMRKHGGWGPFGRIPSIYTYPYHLKIRVI